MASAFPVCNPCQIQGKSSEANNWCIECEEELCDECTLYHRSLKATNNHQVIDVKIKSLYSSVLKSSTYICDQHSGNPLEYFCVDHDKICCRDCIAKTHKTCQNTMSLETAAKNVKQSHLITDCKEHLKNILKICNTITDNRVSNLKKINTCRSKIQKRICEMKEGLIAQINEIERKTLEELDAVTETIVKEYDDQMIKNEGQKKKVDPLSNEIEIIERHGSAKQAFLFICYMKQVLQQTDTDLQNEIDQLKDHTISFSESNDVLPITFGDIKVNQKSSGIVYSPPQIRQAQIISDKAYVLKKFELESRIDVSDSVITGMSVINEDTLLLCDAAYGGSNEVLVCSDNWKSFARIKTSHRVWDISVIPGTLEAAVTHETNEIEFIDTKTLRVSWKVSLDRFKALVGIASTEHSIYVGEKEIIHRLNTNGVVVASIPIPKEHCARYLAIDLQSRIYYSCYQSVHCITMTGTELFSYNIPDERDHRNIAIDKFSYVYIVGQDTSTIHRLSPDGKFDKVILTCENGLEEPLAICFNKNYDKLFVSNDGDKSVLVFKCT